MAAKGPTEWMAGPAATPMVDHTGDVVIDHGPASDTDTVEASISYTLGDSIERLFLKGSDNIDGYGNALDNLIRGNDGDNTLSGGAGADRLYGGAGADTFVFDTRDAPGQFDMILDFAVNQDRIALDHDIFTALGVSANGSLAPGQLAYNTATSADHHLIYNIRTGMLYYDEDGSGADAAIAIARLSQAPALHASDLLVV